MKLSFFHSRSIALFTLIAFCLSGCAGLFPHSGGSSTGLLTVTPQASTVTLPTGTSGVNLATLKVRTSCGDVTVASDGKVSVPIFNGGPQYAELVDATGKTVMMAFISDTQLSLSAETTASALLYLALAGPQLKADGRLKLLAEASTLSGFSGLVTVIENQIKTLGHLDLTATEFQTALANVVNTSMGRGRGVIAEPTTASGLSLDTTVQGKLAVQNVYLRRVNLYLRRTGYITAAGQTVDDDNSEFVKVEMPTVARYGGITGTLDGYLKGEVPYSPVTTDPALDIPRFPADAKQTFYDLYAVGPGGTKGEAYGILPIFAQNDQGMLEVKTIFLDVLLVFIANIALPLKGSEVDDFLTFVGGNAVVTDIIGNLKSNIPQLGELLGQGKYYDALKTIVTSIYTSNTILPKLAQVTLDFLDRNANLSDATYDQIFSGMSGLLDKMGKIDVGFTAADLSLLVFDIARANQADLFKIKVIPGKVTLKADSAVVNTKAKTKVHATIQDKDPNGTYEYQWTVTPNNNYWLDDSHLNGTDDAPDGVLITADDTVEANSLILTDGTASIHCKAFRVDGGRQEVGEGDTTVQFDDAAQIIIVSSANLLSASKIIQIDAFPPFGVPDNYTYQYQFYLSVGPVKDAFRYEVWSTGTTNPGHIASWNTTRQNRLLGTFLAGMVTPPTEPGKYYVGISHGSQQGGWSTPEKAQTELDKVLAGTLNHPGYKYEIRAFIANN